MEQLSLPLVFANTLPEQLIWFKEILAFLNINPNLNWPDAFGLSLRNYFTKSNYTPIKTLSLFTGGGGLDIAFHDAGFDIVQMVELEAKYIQTLLKNSQPGRLLENSQPICIDIREYFPNSELAIDFIIGGPPCQTFSAAGRRASGVAGLSDTRGMLFAEYVRLIKILQPKGFLFENVYGITGAENGEAWKKIQNAFKQAGYQINFRVLDAADYGVPQHRERLFIVGIKEGNYLFPSPTHGPDSPGQIPFYSAGAAVIGADPSDAELGISGRYGYLLNDIPPGLNYSFYTAEMGHPQPVFSWRSKFSDFLYKADPELPVRTIKAQGGQYTGPFSWENRRFTIAELKRLQTFPDAYEIVGNRSSCIEQIGNSVPPQLGRILALSILEQVMNISLPFSMHYLPPTKQLGFRQRKRQLTQRYAQKAQAAIAFLKSNGKFSSSASPHPRLSEKSVRFLSENFAWSKNETCLSTKIFLKYDFQPESWIIEANLNDIWEIEGKYIIDISSANGCENWGLDTTQVKLIARDLDGRIFTALWKAFEEKLTELTRKADLVQLSGYYQYKPHLNSKMTINDQLKNDKFWQIIQCLINGIGVANQLSKQQLAFLWGVNNNEIFSYLKRLRIMGYEIRNHQTNPQINPGEYLIPYAFPTLTPKSVQLRKTLGENDDE